MAHAVRFIVRLTSRRISGSIYRRLSVSVGSPLAPYGMVGSLILFRGLLLAFGPCSFGLAYRR